MAISPMRTLPLVFLGLGLAGCDLLGLSSVEHAVVTAVRVERLDFGPPWDRTVLGDDYPDVYVDLKAAIEPGLFGIRSRDVYRSEVHENLQPSGLPLTVRPGPDDARLALADTVWIDVSDEDSALDDLLFTTGRFRFEEHHDGEAAGESTTVHFEDDAGAVSVTVRWE